ncbi:tetratricopeptide repeat protein [Winogradskyella eckloniae]|uniref:ATP-binding protein n=1 Tax=Winogradskyella eckloniae TaxID=1089306 RepID=UPI001563C492|nr:tetratricopeptide repeat-containing sensor histidine kinase [Winogradskyella eckloniae]NRD19179.1 tetratricopeptide repeat protein [Winogradskyella eckloniae]
MRLSVLMILQLVFFVTLGSAQTTAKKTLSDSVFELIRNSKNENISEEDRFAFAKSANALAKKVNEDSLALITNKNLLGFYFDNEPMAYIQTNQRIVKLSKTLKDSLSLGNANYALGYSYHVKQLNDSAYYYYSNAVKIFAGLSNMKQLSYSLGSLSALQFESKDYYGAEENTVRAIKALDDVEETNDILDQKWILKTNLGSIAGSLNNYDKSLEYHEDAVEIANRMDEDFNNGLYSLNNIAFVKREQGHYNEAKEIFANVLESKNLQQEDPSFYALILENLAFTMYLTGTYNKDNVIALFDKSIKISDSINDRITKTGAVVSMSKFYEGIGNTDKAKLYAKEAYDLAKETVSNEIYLESMTILSKLNEGEEGKHYLYEYINVSDSLLQVERNVRNKFARIELETDQLEAENEQISKKNVYLIFISFGLFITAILTYLFISQRAKNRKLKLIQVQQKANEDIYNLMLVQQDKVDEARAKEKIRVSEELHDGVLGRLFGVRLSLDSINFNEGKDAMMTRAKYISQLQDIEQDIRKISHDLSVDFESGSSFIDIVTELIDTQTQAYGLEHEFNYAETINWDLVPNKTKIDIYRIIQESMQNIYKHANAKTIKISISLEKALICLCIIDDGEGFDTTKSKKGIGLKNMRSRVEDLDGEITWTSQSGNGTEVNVKIPYTNQST